MASLKDAIRRKCKDCIYDPQVPGTYLEQIEMCTSEHSCPLWPVRPMTVATINLMRKNKAASPTEIDIDAVVNGLEDEEPEAEMVAA